ncbi:hypothetical protein Tsp_14391, partial [Trichinella spiralis]|uniref:hypothetical protein n=1 Tax=Trichinella spiralis TaxID=6334 RepID=UPI0001EFEBA2
VRSPHSIYSIVYRGALQKEGGAVSRGLLTQSYCRTTIYQTVEDSEHSDGLWKRPEAFMECGLWEVTELMERNGFLQMLQCNVRCRECFVQCDFNQEKTHSVALQTIPHLTTVQERCCPNTSVLPLYCIHKTASR